MILTNWGYTLTDLNALPDMLTENEYTVFSAGRYGALTRLRQLRNMLR